VYFSAPENIKVFHAVAYSKPHSHHIYTVFQKKVHPYDFHDNNVK